MSNIFKLLSLIVGLCGLCLSALSLIIIPDGFSGLGSTPMALAGAYAPLVALILTIVALVIVWWRAGYASILFVFAAFMQVIATTMLHILVNGGDLSSVPSVLVFGGLLLSAPWFALVGASIYALLASRS